MVRPDILHEIYKKNLGDLGDKNILSSFMQWRTSDDPTEYTDHYTRSLRQEIELIAIKIVKLKVLSIKKILFLDNAPVMINSH